MALIEIDGLPINSMVIFHGELLNNQMVDRIFVAETCRDRHVDLVDEKDWSKRISKVYQWMGFRENLQETIDFPIKYGAFL